MAVDVLVNSKPVRVRLAEIDAPERRQAYGLRAKQALSDLVFQLIVTVRESAPDTRWGRVVGTLKVDGRDVNQVMVAAGMAWVYRKYVVRWVLLDVEAEARAARRGLWADAQAEPPWEWRRLPHGGSEARIAQRCARVRG